MRSIEKDHRFSEELFEFLWCPVCGNDSWTHIVFQGVFCAECNTEAQVAHRRKRDVRKWKVQVMFNSESTLNLHADENPRRNLPDHRAIVFVLESPTGYDDLSWFPTPSRDWEPVEEGEFDDVEEPSNVAHLA